MSQQIECGDHLYMLQFSLQMPDEYVVERCQAAGVQLTVEELKEIEHLSAVDFERSDKARQVTQVLLDVLSERSKDTTKHKPVSAKFDPVCYLCELAEKEIKADLEADRKAALQAVQDDRPPKLDIKSGEEARELREKLGMKRARLAAIVRIGETRLTEIETYSAYDWKNYCAHVAPEIAKELAKERMRQARFVLSQHKTEQLFFAMRFAPEVHRDYFNTPTYGREKAFMSIVYAIREMAGLAPESAEEEAVRNGEAPEPSFLDELRQLLNKHNKEGGSNTPDFILAEYLNRCLDAFDVALAQRTNWYRDDTKETSNAD